MSIRLFKRGTIWHADIHVNGRRKKFSTHRTAKKQAQDVADVEYRRLQDKAQGIGGLDEITLHEALYDHYLAEKEGNPHIKMYTSHVRAVLGERDDVKMARVGLDPNMKFHELTERDLRKYRHGRKRMGVGEQIIDHELKTVSRAYNIVAADYRVRPGLKFPMARLKGKPRYLMPDEEAAFRAELDRMVNCYTTAQEREQQIDNRDAALLMLNTGGRPVSEILGLSWSMVDTIGWKWINLFRPKVSNESYLMLSDEARTVLQRRYEAREQRRRAGKPVSDYVFPGRYADKEAHKVSTAALRRAMNRVGINHPSKVARFGRRDTRSLRDSYATKLRRKGMSLDRLQLLLGHTSPQMTQKYADLGPNEASQEAVEILNQLNGS